MNMNKLRILKDKWIAVLKVYKLMVTTRLRQTHLRMNKAVRQGKDAVWSLLQGKSLVQMVLKL